VPAVLLVQGSGAPDEHATVGPNKPFEDLANGFGGQGIAVLRYRSRAFAYKRWLPARRISRSARR